jgi:hypothetical protein
MSYIYMCHICVYTFFNCHALAPVLREDGRRCTWDPLHPFRCPGIGTARDCRTPPLRRGSPSSRPAHRTIRKDDSGWEMMHTRMRSMAAIISYKNDQTWVILGVNVDKYPICGACGTWKYEPWCWYIDLTWVIFLW